jgi:formylglycine-generating enzyme required for sulfatase activity
MSADRATADREREMWEAAARCHRAADKPLDAGRCLERARRWQEAGRCYEAGGAWKEAVRCYEAGGVWKAAARCYEQNGRWLQAAWLYADALGWYVNAEVVLNGTEQHGDAERASAASVWRELGRELVLARCAAGRRRETEAAMRLRAVLARASETSPRERRALRPWGVRVSEVLKRPDLGLELHWELASGDKESETEWEAYTTRVLGEFVAYQLPGRSSDGDGPERLFVEPTTGMRFLWVPGGRFWMGSGADEEDTDEDEKPRHLEELSGFWLAETPVTNRQYEVFLWARRVSEEPRFWRDRKYNQPEQPVVGVSWLEAREFCRWLSERAGQRMDLPTEAQWERAARGDDERKYPWGDEEPDGTRAHYGNSWVDGAPLRVGSLPWGRGPYGHLDLAGNVWEWCQDDWGVDSYPFSGTTDGSQQGEARACRGGAFGVESRSLRSAFRLRSRADRGFHDLGFRVAASPRAVEI